MDLNIIKKRVQKLLALSSSPNEAEATLAMEKCRELMEKYDIRTIDVDVMTGEVAVETTTMQSQYKKHEQWETALGAGIAGCFDAKCLYYESNNKTTILFIASKTDSIFITDLFKRTRRIISRAATEYTMGCRAKVSMGYSFKMGAVDTITKRLLSVYSADAKGLVVYKEDAIQKRVQEMFSNIVEKAPKRTSDKEAYLAGAEAASSICLGKSIQGGQSSSLLG